MNPFRLSPNPCRDHAWFPAASRGTMHDHRSKRSSRWGRGEGREVATASAMRFWGNYLHLEKLVPTVAPMTENLDNGRNPEAAEAEQALALSERARLAGEAAARQYVRRYLLGFGGLLSGWLC